MLGIHNVKIRSNTTHAQDSFSKLKKKKTLSNLGRGLSDNRLLPNLSRNGELEPIF